MTLYVAFKVWGWMIFFIQLLDDIFHLDESKYIFLKSLDGWNIPIRRSIQIMDENTFK